MIFHGTVGFFSNVHFLLMFYLRITFLSQTNTNLRPCKMGPDLRPPGIQPTGYIGSFRSFLFKIPFKNASSLALGRFPVDQLFQSDGLTLFFESNAYEEGLSPGCFLSAG